MIMAKEIDDPLRDERLRQLLAELEGSSQGPSRHDDSKRERSNHPAAFLRWFLCSLFFLGLGFWAGSYHQKLRFSLQQPSERQLLAIQGWRHDGSGVFYRWCPGLCHAPRLYGGGLIQVFEVKCVDRPCGDLSMVFSVFNSKGEVVDRVVLADKGLQGETRRFFVESRKPDAASVELSEFSSRARV
jgi:hypothetical protein